MAQDTNKLLIQGDNQWKPPTSPLDVDSWTPPTAPVNQKPVMQVAEPQDSGFNPLSALMNAPKFITDPANRAADIIDAPHLPKPLEESGYQPELGLGGISSPLGENDPVQAGFRAGGLQGVARGLSPFNIGSTLLGMGEAAALRSLAAGNEAIIPTIQTLAKIRQLMSGGMMAGGAKHLLSPDSSLEQRLWAIPELLFGYHGMTSGKFIRKPTEDWGRYRTDRALGPAPPGTPRFYGGNAGLAEGNINVRDTQAPYDVQNPQGGALAPGDLGERHQIPPEIAAAHGIQPGIGRDIELPAPTRTPNIDPNRFPIEGIAPAGAKGKTPQEKAYDLAREKFSSELPDPELQSIINLAQHELAKMKASYGEDSEEYKAALEELQDIIRSDRAKSVGSGKSGDTRPKLEEGKERTREELDAYSPLGSVAKQALAMIEKHGLDKAFDRALSMVERQKSGSVVQDYWRAIVEEIENKIEGPQAQRDYDPRVGSINQGLGKWAQILKESSEEDLSSFRDKLAEQLKDYSNRPALKSQFASVAGRAKSTVTIIEKRLDDVEREIFNRKHQMDVDFGEGLQKQEERFGKKKPIVDPDSMEQAELIAGDFDEDFSKFKTAKEFHTYMAEKYGPEYTKALNATKPATEISKTLDFPLKPIAPEHHEFGTLLDKDTLTQVEFDKIESTSKELPKAPKTDEPGLDFMRVPVPGSPRDNIVMGGADPAVLDALGTALYTKPRDIVAVKELLQNAFDEHRTAGQTKPIYVGVMSNIKVPGTGVDGQALIVRDFGRGMTPDQLYTIFTDLGKTGKKYDPSASGGFGLAKAAPMLGGQFFRAESTVIENGEKVTYSFEGNPKQLKNQMKGVPLNREVKPPNTETGLKVKVYYDNTKTYLNRDAVETATQAFTENSPSITSPTKFSRDYSSKAETNFDEWSSGVPFTPTKYSSSYDPNMFREDEVTFTKLPAEPLKDTISIPGADIDIRYEDKPKGTHSQYKLHLLNKGLYQATLPGSYSQRRALDNVPKNIIADIKATVEEGEDDYPFGANREDISDKVTLAIKDWVRKNIIAGSLQKQQDQLKGIYADIGNLTLPGTVRKPSFFDSGGRLTLSEETEVLKSPVTEELIRHFDSVLNDIVKVVDAGYGNTERADKLEGVGLMMSEPGFHGLHVPSPFDPFKSSILINPFDAMSNHDPYDAAVFTMVTAMHEAAHISPDEAKGFSHRSVAEINDPRIGEYLQIYLKELDAQGGLNAGHAEDWLRRLAEVFTRYGPTKTFEQIDKFHGIVTDESGGYNDEVQKLLQIYSDSRGRPETTEDFLSSTGVKSESPKGGKKGVRIRFGSNGERTPPNKQIIITDATHDERFTPPHIIGKLTRAVRDARPVREQQEEIYSAERAKRILKAENILKQEKNQNLKGFIKAKIQLKGKYPKIKNQKPLISNSERDALIKGIVNSPYLLPFERIRAIDGLRKLLGSGPVPQRNELDLLHQVYGKPFDEIIQMHGGLGALMPSVAVVSDIVNLPKAIMASYDLSAPLRQGLPLIHKRQWREAIIPMLKSLRDPAYFEALQKSLKDRPYYLLGKEAKLALTDVGDVINKEEAFPTKIASKIPGLAHSERAYVGFLNKLRADTFDALIDDAKKLGKHPKDVMFEIARFVNTMTGRGSLDFSESRAMKALGGGRENFGNLDKVSNELNAVFFSPRLIASRLTILNLRYYVKASPFIRKEALKSLMAIAGAGMIINSIMKSFGAKINTSLSDTKGTGIIPGTGGIPYLPINADFGKAKIGNTRDDPWGGLQQYLVFAGRMLSGETESSVTNKRSILGKGFNAQTRWNVLDDFVGNKLAPIPSLARVALKQKDYEGNPIQFGPDFATARESAGKGNILDALTEGTSGELANRYKPMLLNDLLELYKDDPNLFPAGVKPIMAIHSLLGGSLQTYKRPPKKTNQFRFSLGK